MPTGWLWLEGPQRRSAPWAQRFFVLDEGYLRYFINDEDLDPVATVNVRGVEATGVGKQRVGKNAFRLNVTRQADGRYKYVLAGDTEAESRKWLTWLVEEGVSANVSAINLSAKPVKGVGSMKKLMLLKGIPKSEDKKASEGSMKKLMAFGGPRQSKAALDEVPPSSSACKSLKGDKGDKDPIEPASARLSTAAFGTALAHQRSLLIPQSSIEVLVKEGSVNGDRPFVDVYGDLGRQGLVEVHEKARRSTRGVSPSRRATQGASPSRRSTRTASTPSPPMEGAEDDDSGDAADEFDEVDDQPAVAPGSEGSTVGVVYTLEQTGEGTPPTTKGDEAPEQASGVQPAEQVKLGSFRSFSFGGMDGATLLQNSEVAEPDYRDNVSQRAPPDERQPDMREGEAPQKRPSLTDRLAEAGRAMSSSLSATFVTPMSDDLTTDALGQSVTATIIQAALHLAAGDESSPKHERPSLLARLSGSFDIQTPPPSPAPKMVFVDSAEDARVRAWIKQALLAADDVKTLDTLNDTSSSLRDQLRSGVLLCAVLNALKPGAVGRVRSPAATSSRFAKLEPLNTYKRACGTAGLTDVECLDPHAWLDGESMVPLVAHVEALCRLNLRAPQFDPPGGKQRPQAHKLANATKGGVMPLHSAQDVMKAKGGAHSQTRSVASAGAKAWRGADSNASAARAVFEIENGNASAGKPDAKEDTKTAAKVTVRSATGATHSFAESETVAFSEYINETLSEDSSLSHLLPLQVDSMDLFDVLKDGVVLCKLINSAQAETIDMRCVHTGAFKPLSVYEVVENLNMAINAAVAIGCRVVNIGHDDVMSGSPHLVLGLLWQIVKAGIMAKINLKACPELIQLLSEADDMEALRALLALPPEKVLLRWLNFQVQRVAPGFKEVTNFGSALKDSMVYAHLLTAVAPKHRAAIVQGLVTSVGCTSDPLVKAQLVIDAAVELGVTQFKVFAGDVTKGNEKLNMGFMAAIFNHLPGLTAPSEHGTFGASLAHPSAVIKESGHAVRLTHDGCALFGPALAKGSGVHWVELRILEATGGCYLGLMEPTNNFRTRAPGLAAGSVGLARTGELWSSGVVAQPDCTGGFAIGDLIRIEYSANERVLSFTTNGMLHANVPGGMHFGVGVHGGGAFEVRIENCSFATSTAAMALPAEDEGDSREERAFRIWINSLGLDTHVSDLPSQVRDGLLLLQLMDAIKPGVVDWSKATKKPKNVHAKVINCNYAVSLGKSAFGFSLVGISGKDVQDGITKLVLALTWQLMRYHVIKFLSTLSHKQLTEKDVVDWANAKVGGGLPPITKLSDASLSSGTFVLHLLKAVAPRCVDMSQVAEGKTAEEKKLNARLAVSCARKAGCMVFLLWEDIVDCKPKMLLVLFASLMQLEISDKVSRRGSQVE